MSASESPAAGDASVAARPSGTAGAIALVAGIVVADQVTKHLAVTRLERHVPESVIGDVARFTLTYNPGAAFGMHFGEASRVVFTVLTVVILAFLVRLYRSLPAGERALRLAIAAVMGGAVGNLIDRFRSPLGVVDFIDVGVGDTRFWTFNVADSAVSVGAVLLVLLLWRYEGRLHAQREAAERAAAEGAAAEPVDARPADARGAPAAG